jgi:hypothetical protein
MRLSRSLINGVSAMSGNTVELIVMRSSYSSTRALFGQFTCVTMGEVFMICTIKYDVIYREIYARTTRILAG